MAVIVGQKEWGWEEQIPPNLSGHFRCVLHEPGKPLDRGEGRGEEGTSEGEGARPAKER